MHRRDFIESPEWQRIALAIRELVGQVSENTLDIAQTSSFDVVRYNSGFIDGLRTVLDMPNRVLTDEDEEKQSDSERNVIAIAGSPAAKRRSTPW